MRLASAIFICCLAIYQPASAVVTIPADEEKKLIPHDDKAKPLTTATPKPKVNISPDESPGHMLYENHCTSCHESMVHIRAKRKANNYKEVGYWVNLWADWLKLDWTAVEKREVMQYLNQYYYKYPMKH